MRKDDVIPRTVDELHQENEAPYEKAIRKLMEAKLKDVDGKRIPRQRRRKRTPSGGTDNLANKGQGLPKPMREEN